MLHKRFTGIAAALAVATGLSLGGADLKKFKAARDVLDAARRALDDVPAPDLWGEAERRAAAANTVWSTGCNSWYLDRHGVPATWTFSWDRFCDEMAAPKLAEFDVR